ncbi:hypothetical protein L1987_72244 [Smallanthus sonchifolius]|uniref:Uncharacterized protein n=1 Tax=Smallanthus sonchifolius TaxID=185202 RepID=A0ACB9AUP8_9ASTR|nr:hypothetical protein L1987_72244 [Smallanthus sonchifolius]
MLFASFWHFHILKPSARSTPPLDHRRYLRPHCVAAQGGAEQPLHDATPDVHAPCTALWIPKLYVNS